MMKRTCISIAIVLICLVTTACASRGVKGTVAGVEVTVDSAKRTREYKQPGSGTGYGQMRPFEADAGKEFMVVELKAPKKIELGEQGIKATLKDDQGQTYNSIYSEVFAFVDGKAEAKILFEIPEHASIASLMLDQTPFDLSKAMH